MQAPLLARARLWWRQLRRGRMPEDKAVGFLGEDAAARFLRRQGYAVLARNVEAPMGEADLVCRAPDERTMVIVEVKTRLVAAAERAGDPERYLPEDAVGWAKRKKLAAIAAHLKRLNRWGRRPVRIDVVAIEWPPTGAPIVRHWVDAVK
ncbi:MAG: YraN family protein [Polaromonas sp.]